MSNDNKEKKENRGTGKKVKRNNIIDQYFNRAIIIFLLVMMLLMIYNLRQYGQLYQSIDNLNQAYSDIQTENRVLKERIEKHSVTISVDKQ